MLLEFFAAQVLDHRALQAATGEGDVEHVGADVLLQEAGEVVVLAAVAGADQGDLGVAAVTEQVVAAAGRAFRLGGELVHVLHGVAGAAELAGNVVQGAGLAHAPGLVGFEFLARDAFEGRHLVHGFGHDPGGTLGAVRRPVLVTAEVEVLALIGGGQLLVGQRRKVGTL